MRRKNRNEHLFRPEDEEALRQLNFALMQVEELPALDQWPTACSLLPDSFFCHILKTRALSVEMQVLERLGPVAYLLAHKLLGEEPNESVMFGAIFGLTVSAGVEMERRYPGLCETLDVIENPFIVAIQEKPPFTMKSGEEPRLDVLLDHHTNRCA